MQVTRVLMGAAFGLLAGGVLTRVVLLVGIVRIWLVNVPSLAVWGTAIVAGLLVGLVCPRRFEVPVAAFSVLVGSVGMILWFAAYGGSLSLSLADAGTLRYLGASFLVSGLCLFVLAALGAWVVAGVRSRVAKNGRNSAVYGREQFDRRLP